MPVARLFPRLRFVRNFTLALFALTLLTNLTDSAFTRVLAPVQAKAVAEAKFFIPADVPSSGDADIDRIIFEAGVREGVDPRLIHAVIWQESRYKPAAVSHAGAQGLMQLMPAAAKRFKCEDRNDPAANVAAGTKYLRWLLKRFDGNVTLALAGYNAGEGSVDKHDGVPPFDETQKYVRVITGRYGKNYHPTLTPEEATDYFRLAPTHEVATAE
ncbi:MAG: lytic transglycosylase domain-containing protein [Acidobacteriota bacterium]|nr:lytic transglycosylase domain-containing protein [Acidobacteriota bacterium]